MGQISNVMGSLLSHGLTEFRTIAKVQHFIKLPLGSFFPSRAEKKKNGKSNTGQLLIAWCLEKVL